jgi:RNA polymerase sigma-70 factor (ECF subfamily)
MSLPTNGSARSDEALMARVQSGDTGAVGELYDRHATRALRVARAICVDAGRAEDAMKDAFLAIWTDRARFDPAHGSFKAWSMSIVRNRAISSNRAAEARPSPHPAEAHAEEPDAMLASLRELPEAQAEVIALALFGELSHSEIAALLELPSGTVKGRMRLGLEKLRKQMSALP